MTGLRSARKRQRGSFFHADHSSSELVVESPYLPGSILSREGQVLDTTGTVPKAHSARNERRLLDLRDGRVFRNGVRYPDLEGGAADDALGDAARQTGVCVSATGTARWPLRPARRSTSRRDVGSGQRLVDHGFSAHWVRERIDVAGISDDLSAESI